MSRYDLDCEQVTALLADPSGPLGPAAEAHLANCAPCRQVADAQRPVLARLAGLVAAKPPTAPREIEAHLLARFSEARVRSRRPGRVAAWTMAAGMALAGSLGAAYLFRRSGGEPSHPAPPAPLAAATSEMDRDLRLPAESLQRSDLHARRFRALGLLESARPLEHGQVARVEIAQEVAAYLGWPLLPDVPGGRVQADILYGEDGTARAVRFLPATFRSGGSR